MPKGWYYKAEKIGSAYHIFLHKPTGANDLIQVSEFALLDKPVEEFVKDLVEMLNDELFFYLEHRKEGCD